VLQIILLQWFPRHKNNHQNKVQENKTKTSICLFVLIQLGSTGEKNNNKKKGRSADKNSIWK